MSQSKKNMIYLGIAIVLIASYFFITTIPKQVPQEEEPSEETIRLLNIDPNSITQMRFINENGDYVLYKTEDGWKAKGKEYMALEQGLVETVASDLSRLTMSKKIEENVDDFAKYGISETGNRIEFNVEDTIHTLFIGDEVKGNGGNYVMLDSFANVYQYSGFYMSGKLEGLHYFRTGKLFKTSGDEIQSVTIGNDTNFYEMHRTNLQGLPHWEFVKPFSKEGNSEKINKEIINKIIELKADEFVVDFPQNLSDYGLDKPYYTLSFTDSNNVTYGFAFGRADGQYTYFKSTDQNIVYAIATEKVAFLKIPVDDLIHKLIYIEDIKNINSINLKIGKKTAYLTMKQNEGNVAYYLNDIRITDTEFSKQYIAILNMLSLDGVVKKDENAVVAGTITVTKTDGNTDIIELKQIDNRQYMVVVNGQGHFWISKSKVDELLQKY